MPVTVMLPDGSSRELPEGATAADLAADIGERLAKDAVIATIDGEERDLVTPLPENADVAIVTADSERGRYTIRHSTAHVLAQAVLDLFPGSTFAIGPPIEDGFYYDFELPAGGTFTDDLERIEARMREIIAEEQPFIRDEIAEAEAKLFAHHPYKLEILEGAANDPMSATDKGLARTYENPPRFIDLCRGPHVPHTGRLGHFKLLRVAGAYWRGDERSRSSSESMARRGSPRRRSRTTSGVWPRPARPPAPGGRARSALVPGRARGRPGRLASAGGDRAQDHRGLQPGAARAGRLSVAASVRTSRVDPLGDQRAPRLVRRRHVPAHGPGRAAVLPQADELPVPHAHLPQPPAVVPRAPHSAVRAGHRVPLRALGRPSRADADPGFTQDDSHIFCTREQLVDEISGLLDFSLDVLRAFGFDDFEAELSTRPQDRSVGDDDEWDEATTALRTAIERAGLEYEVAEGEGVLRAEDRRARPRRHRTALAALHHPGGLPVPPAVRPQLRRAGQHTHRPCVIHRALMGSIERFFGVLLEHPRAHSPSGSRPSRCGSFPSATITRSTPRASSSDWSTSASVRSWPRPATPWARSVRPSWRRCHTSSWSERTTWGPARSGSTRAQEVERDVPLDDFIERLATDVAERR